MNNNHTLYLRESVYQGHLHYTLHFDYNQQLIQDVKQFKALRWSATLKAWYFKKSALTIKRLRQKFGERLVSEIERDRDKKKLTNEQQLQISTLKKWMLGKRYSQHTIDNYCSTLEVFFRFFESLNANEITENHITHFNNEFILCNKLSVSYQNQFINALKLLLREVSHTTIDAKALYRPKNERKLPVILAQSEVQELINATANIKHRTMLAFIYSAGLRRSELLEMKITDIDSKRMLIRVRQAKGRKDRMIPLSVTLLEMLREYYLAYKPTTYLFEGQFKEKYSARSIANVLIKAANLAGIKKDITLHTLRHSYATHLMEGGTHLRFIQELLGHKDPKTTQIYTYVSSENLSNVTSPLDKLKINKKK